MEKFTFITERELDEDGNGLLFPSFLPEYTGEEKFQIWKTTVHVFGEQAGFARITPFLNLLNWIFIEPKFRCSGVGGALLDHLVKEYDVKKLIAHADENMGIDITRLKEFYEQHGFNVTESDVMVYGNAS